MTLTTQKCTLLHYTAILLDLHNRITLNIAICNYTECLKQVRGGSETNSKVNLRSDSTVKRTTADAWSTIDGTWKQNFHQLEEATMEQLVSTRLNNK